MIEKLKKGNLSIGWATENITPQVPIALYGQYYDRIAEYVESPLTVTAFAMESIVENSIKEQTIMVSMDLIYSLRDIQDELKRIISQLLPDFESEKLFLNATHTHSAPYPGRDTKYGEFLLEQLTKVIVRAWNRRQPSAVSSVIDYAVVGHNRRIIYADGTAEMYGDTDRADFIGVEGSVDSSINMLYCWDLNGLLTGIIMNVSCPAQVTESKYFVSADYWSEVRKQLKEKLSPDLYILAQCGAAGDISPRDLPTAYRAGESNMWDLAGMIEIGKRLTHVVFNKYEEARQNMQSEVVFKHAVKDIQLPFRRINEEEYNTALKIVTEIRSKEPDDINSPDTAWNRFLQDVAYNEEVKDVGPWDSKTSDFGWLKPQELIVDRYRRQVAEAFYVMELHVLRIGDIVFATNPFELFVDYGFVIKGRSKAKQTFIVQFACDSGGYLATERALTGGGYSAMANEVGPSGAKVLIQETLNLIDSMWE